MVIIIEAGVFECLNFCPPLFLLDIKGTIKKKSLIPRSTITDIETTVPVVDDLKYYLKTWE